MRNLQVLVSKPRGRLCVSWKSVWALLTFVLCLSVTGWAQDQATITGTVTDPSDAVIPGAKVTLSNPDKGFTRQTESNAAGDYTVAKVPTGNYSISAESTGFQKLLRTGITLSVGQTLRVDLQLTVGQTSQEITVSGNVAKVETEMARVSDVITGKQVMDLNLNGRNFATLALLVPGASPDATFDATKVGFGSQVRISFNGNRIDFINVEVDGANNNDESGGGKNVQTFPNIDSIEEFRVTTSNYGAEIGKRPGAVIEVVTKSGTKSFHGTAYEFIRNDVLDANAWFVNRRINPPGGNAPKLPLKWNSFGYNLGGPLYIPGHYNTDRSKTFFFWSEAWARYREGKVFSAITPTLRMRNGDFSECDPASPNYNAIAASGCTLPKNPATGLRFPGDIVPIDPNAAALLAGLVPLPNSGVNGYVASPSLPNDYRQEHLRVDQNVGQNARIFFSGTQEKHPVGSAGSTYDTIIRDGHATNTPNTKSAALHFSQNLKSNLMNEFILGYSNDVQLSAARPGPSSPAHSVQKPASWTATTLFPPNAQLTLLPGVSVSGGTGFSFNQNTGRDSGTNYVPTATLKDNLAYSRGKHTLKFGFYLLVYRASSPNQFANAQGALTFSASGPLNTGNALANMYLGRIQQYSEGTSVQGGTPVGGYGLVRWRANGYEPYFQDDWKVNRKLSLNLGVRYQYHTAYTDVSNPTADTNFLPEQYDPAAQAQLDAKGRSIPGSGHDYSTYGNGLIECGKGGVPVGCSAPYKRAWGPRFGFAFDPSGSGMTSIRGGFGLYYDLGNGHSPNVLGASGGPPASLIANAYDVDGYGSITPGPLPALTMYSFPEKVKVPTVYQFSFTGQHEFPGNNLLGVGYVGSLGRHLDRAINIDQVPVGVGTLNAPALAGKSGCDALGNCDVQSVLINGVASSIFFVPYRGFDRFRSLDDTAVSNYHSLQANYRHIFSGGLTLQAAYTWSHSIDDSGDGYFLTGVDDLTNLSRWRGNSDFNRTHIVQVNYVYDLPFFKNATNSFLKNGLGGWQLSGITSLFTGTPVDFTCNHKGNSSGIGQSMKCNTLGPLKVNKGISDNPNFGPTPRWFDPDMIGMATLSQFRADGQPGMFGYMGRNVLTGPGRNNWDIALLKNFKLGERATVQFRWETFNTFNHPQWKTISAGCGNNTPYGAACSGNEFNLGNGEVASAWDPRLMQFALKFLF